MFGKKKKVEIVCDLDLDKYLGVWYEIAKMSSRSQMGLDNVSAKYSLKKNGKIRVHNVGFKNRKKKQITGTAWLKDASCKGAFNVRFFWPFKADYNVILLADDYRYAVVMGKSKSQLWILSRSHKLNNRDYKHIIGYLDERGFKTRKLIETKQDTGLFK